MEIMKIKETRKIDIDLLRSLCVNHNLFTKGNFAEYATMLDNAERIDFSNTVELFDLCLFIFEHTDISKCNDIFDNDYCKNDNVLNLMYYISKQCVNTFYEIENI